MTTVRRAVLTLPAAPLGPDDPLPVLRAPGPLPAPVREGDGRDRAERTLDALVLENDRLRVTVLPGLGGRVHSLHHKPTRRELLHRDPEFPPVASALDGIWFAGGIAWPAGAAGHGALSGAPVHAATVPAPDGTPMIRLWEWERLHGLPVQVDLWLPEGSDFLYAGVRVRNPHERPAPVSWWPHAAVPERCRIGRRWIAALDEDGTGLARTSTDAPPVRAGLAGTPLELRALAPESELSRLEAYGPLAADPGTAPGAGRAAARAAAERALDLALPRTAVDAAHTAWRERAADTDPAPDAVLAAGSGWGALDVLRGGHVLPGTPFPASTLGADQEPWRALLRTGVLPPPAKGAVPHPPQVGPAWRDMLETAPADPSTEYHLGIAQWHAGDRAQAVRSWERGLARAEVRWPLLYCLAVADREEGHRERAAHRFAEACGELDGTVDGPAAGTVAAALTREAVDAQLAADRPERARALWRALPEEVRARGAFRLLEVRVLLAEGRPAEARAVFDAAFEVPGPREGAEPPGDLWSRITGERRPEA